MSESEIRPGEILKYGRRKFRVLKVNKRTIQVREVFHLTRKGIITETVGDFYEIKREDMK